MVFLAFVVIFWLPYHTCFDILPINDSPATRLQERSELLRGILSIYVSDSKDSNLPKPLSAEVSQKTATIVVSGPMPTKLIDKRYATVWRDVFVAHHGGQDTCVHMNIAWKGGSIRQDCCFATI